MTLDIERPSASAVTDFYRQVAERFPEPAELAPGADRPRRCCGPPPRGPISPPSATASRQTSSTTSRSAAGSTSTPTAAPARAAKELPWLVVQMSRLRFGGIGPSTHFLELQEVEDILDPAAAAELGIRPGQVTVQFHNGGGVLTGQLGALYARRKSASRMLRAEMSVQKPLTHLLHAAIRAQAAAGGLLHRGLPVGSRRRRRRPPGPAGDQARDELRLRLPDGHLRRAAPDGPLGVRGDREPGGRLAAQLDLRGRGGRNARVRAPAQRLPRLSRRRR